MVHSLGSIWRAASSWHGGEIMRCLSCNANLSDREANRKYENADTIANPESRYIGLCDDCMLDTNLFFVENPNLSNDSFESEERFEEPVEVDPSIWDER